MKKYTEETLIFYLRQGDKEAFQQLYVNYYTALLRVITHIVKDPLEAEDLLQDTYAKVWQRFHYFDPQQGGLFNWLLNIARNTALDSLRRRKLFLNLCTKPNVLPTITSYLPVTDTIEVECFVKRVLRPQQWQVIDLAYWQGYTHGEIADQLALPLGTVKSRIRQSLIRLRPFFDLIDSRSQPTALNR